MEKKKQQQSIRRKQEDEALKSLFIWFAVAIGYEAVVLLLRRFVLNNRTQWEYDLSNVLATVFFFLRFAALLAAIGTAVWLAKSLRAGKPWKLPAIWTAALAGLSATVCLTSLYTLGFDILGTVAPAMAVMSLVFYLYQREFFYSTVLLSGGMFALWLYRRMFAYHPTMIRLGFVLGWLLLAAAAFLTWKLSRNHGLWKRRLVISDAASYPLIYLTCVITAVTMLAALFGGASAAFYAIFVLVIWMFCLAVYYTVRLM